MYVYVSLLLLLCVCYIFYESNVCAESFYIIKSPHHTVAVLTVSKVDERGEKEMKRIETILRHVNSRHVKSGDKIRINIVGKTEEGKDTALFEKNTCVLEIGERRKGFRPAFRCECMNMKLNQVKHFVIRPGDASHPQSYRDPDLCVTHRLPPGSQRPQIGMLGQIRHENRLNLEGSESSGRSCHDGYERSFSWSCTQHDNTYRIVS